jgi:biotin operon repressor
MTYLERKEKENHLLYLIEHERLYSLEKVANDFECSIRTIKRMLTSLRNEGYEIFYCRKNCRYFFNK